MSKVSISYCSKYIHLSINIDELNKAIEHNIDRGSMEKEDRNAAQPTCAFCGEVENFDILGPLLGPIPQSREYIHRPCALWSPLVRMHFNVSFFLNGWRTFP